MGRGQPALFDSGIAGSIDRREWVPCERLSRRWRPHLLCQDGAPHTRRLRG